MNRHIRAAWRLQLGPSSKLVLVALADYAGPDSRCWPSVPALSRRTGLSDRQVQRSLRALLTAQLLAVEERGQRPGRGRSGRAPIYRLLLDEHACAADAGSDGDDRRSPRGGDGCDGVSPQTAAGGDPVSPQAADGGDGASPRRVNGCANGCANGCDGVSPQETRKIPGRDQDPPREPPSGFPQRSPMRSATAAAGRRGWRDRTHNYHTNELCRCPRCLKIYGPRGRLPHEPDCACGGCLPAWQRDEPP